MRPIPEPGTEPQMMLNDLVDELVEAHMDTIELAADADLGVDWDHLLHYLRALVREAQALQAAAVA